MDSERETTEVWHSPSAYGTIAGWNEGGRAGYKTMGGLKGGPGGGEVFKERGS